MNLVFRRPKLGRTSCNAIAEYSKHEWHIQVSGNDVWPEFDRENLLFRWGCTGNSPHGKQQKVVNTAGCIHIVNDKLAFRRLLDVGGLCPKTWFSALDPNLTFPCIVRPQFHAQGRQLYVCENGAELQNITDMLGDFYISELINKVAEYRVFCIQGKVACVAQKTPGNPDDIAWNVAQGGRFDNVRWGEWNVDLCSHALQSFNLSGLDFGGVDVMVDDMGRQYTLEINSAPSLTSPYRQQCFARCFDYIIDHGVDAIVPSVGDRGYRRYIHPAVATREE